MKVRFCLPLAALVAIGCATRDPNALLQSAEDRLAQDLPGIFAQSAESYRALDMTATTLMLDFEGKPLAPHGFLRDKGQLDMRSIYWWTAGHFPGSLWLLHEATGDWFLRDRAKAWTERLAPNAKVTNNHDVGFVMQCSYGNARRLLKTGDYDDLLAEAAASLCRRFNPELGLIRSWGAITNRDEFLVIPDNLMNLELLEEASRMGKGPENGAYFDRVARSHADVTMRNHFDEYGACHHVLNYSQADGRVQEIRRGQGASCTTAWSRGQAWAIYGYTMMYRYTRDARYRDFARKLADYAINHPHMPADGVPYWDFGAPGEERDSSAAAVMASALLELQGYVDEPAARARYRAFAVRQLTTLSSSEYRADKRELGGFILRHGVGNKPGASEIDTPLDYGDYYYLEALVRFRRLRENEKR